jgi:Na+/H+ antiporter NhaD/arsenite permease-like protein
MSTEFLERAVAIIGAVIVGGTAVVQLRNELPLRSLDANVTKLLLGLMIVGCVLAFLAAFNVLGAHSAA